MSAPSSPAPASKAVGTGKGLVFITGAKLWFMVAGYVASALACLTLHHLAGEQELSSGGPPQPAAPARLVLASLLRAAAVGLSAVLLFLLTPRVGLLGENPLRRAVRGAQPGSLCRLSHLAAS